MADRVTRQIFAFSGVLGGKDAAARNFALTEHALSLALVDKRRLRLCYVPTAVGDSAAALTSKQEQFARLRPDVEFTSLTLFTQPNVPDVEAHLLSQDVVLVEGGSVVNLLAIWRAHHLPTILRRCWNAGVVLAGASAGSLCWHTGGTTDSWGNPLQPFTDGLGFVPFSNNVHDDLDEQQRHHTYRALVANGTLPPGYATPGGVALHYIDTTLTNALSVVPGKQAWYVDHTTGISNGTPVETNYLSPHT